MWLQIVRHRTVRLQTKYTGFLLKVNSENAIIDKRILSICRRQPLCVARRRGRGAVNTFQLSCFLQVAETLNFARAAEILHVTQPAVTQQIRSLEKELGVPLFHRTTRSVKLTQAGAQAISFGVYYRSLQGDAPLRAFVRALRESFAANGPYSDENA